MTTTACLNAYRHKALGGLFLLLALAIFAADPHAQGAGTAVLFLGSLLLGAAFCRGLVGQKPGIARLLRAATSQHRVLPVLPAGLLARTYRYERGPAQMAWLVGVSAFYLALGSALGWLMQDTPRLALVVGGFPLLVGLLTAWYAWRYTRLSVRVSSAGLSATTWIGSTRIRWDEILALTSCQHYLKFTPAACVFTVHTHSGKKLCFADSMIGASELCATIQSVARLEWN